VTVSQTLKIWRPLSSSPTCRSSIRDDWCWSRAPAGRRWSLLGCYNDRLTGSGFRPARSSLRGTSIGEGRAHVASGMEA
jgi:hypothetical protein